MMKSLNCLVSKRGFNARLHSVAAIWPENNCTDTSNFINGQWVKSSSSKPFKTLNPATGEVVAEIQDGNETNVNKSAGAPKKAFKLRSPWRSINPSKRGVLPNKLDDFMKRDAVYLTSLETSDYSKRYTASYSVDVASSVQKGNLIAFKRAHQIPQGLISKMQIRTYRSYSTDSGNDTSSNIVKSTRRNDPEKSSSNDIVVNEIINDPEKFATWFEDRLRNVKDICQRIVTETDLSKRSELRTNLLDVIKTWSHVKVSCDDKIDRKLRESERAKKYESESIEHVLFFVRCRGAIETFESDYDDSAVIDYESFSEDISWTEKDIRSRALLYEWILANRSEEFKVKILLELVNVSKAFDSLSEFCNCIARVHEDLCKTIRVLALKLPTLKDADEDKCVTINPKASEALSIFMSAFQVNDSVAVNKVSDQEHKCVTTYPKASKALSIFMYAYLVNDFASVNEVSNHEKIITQKLKFWSNFYSRMKAFHPEIETRLFTEEESGVQNLE